jgi:Protein of unknown function (DUF3891)
MILRREAGRGVLAIGQASHAWISGQLARAWGNQRFGTIEPREEVCLAAEQHDVGMAEWDLHPSFDAGTGLPHSFTDMPLDVHMRLWREGPRKLISQSRWAALLVSMHGMRLYEMRDLARLREDEAEAVRAFLREQRELQATLLSSLQVAQDTVKRGSDLLWTWDYLSLALCLDWAPCAAKAVPTANTPVTLHVQPDGERCFCLDPWPFAGNRLAVHAEGRRLAERYETAQALREGLESARWETIVFELRSA